MDAACQAGFTRVVEEIPSGVISISDDSRIINLAEAVSDFPLCH